MSYNLMAEFHPEKGERPGGLFATARRVTAKWRGGTDWQAVCALTASCRSGLTFFPVPAEQEEGADALAISIPISVAGPELWQELDCLLTTLQAQFGATVVDLHSGETLAGDFVETLPARFSQFVDGMAQLDQAVAVEETSRWLEGIRADGLNLRFDRESLAQLDAIVERNRAGLDAGTVEEFSKYIGVFLGECLVAIHGGEWRYSAEHREWGVYFENLNLFTFPRSKAAKHLSLGAGHSILYFFDYIGALIERGGVNLHFSDKVGATDEGGRVDPFLLDWGPATVEVLVSDGQKSTVMHAVNHHLATPEGQERSARFMGALARYFETFKD